MTTGTTKAKRDRAAARRHRRIAIQTIIDNHDQVRTDIDSLNGRVAQHTKDVNANVGFAMQCIVENERRLTETETAVGILQGAGKDQHKALAQLNRYTRQLHAKQTSQNRDLTIVHADLAELEKKFITLAWINLGIWVAAALTIFILLII